MRWFRRVRVSVFVGMIFANERGGGKIKVSDAFKVACLQRVVLAHIFTVDTLARATAALSSPPRLSSTTFFISCVFCAVVSFAKTSATMYPPGSGVRFTLVSGSGPPLHLYIK